MLGRSPADEGTLAFPVTQRYDDEVVRWDGAADPDNPAPMLEVAEGAGGNAGESAGDAVAKKQAQKGLSALLSVAGGKKKKRGGKAGGFGGGGFKK